MADSRSALRHPFSEAMAAGPAASQTVTTYRVGRARRRRSGPLLRACAVTAAVGGAAAGWWLTGPSLPSAAASSQSPVAPAATGSPREVARITPSTLQRQASGASSVIGGHGSGGSARHHTGGTTNLVATPTATATTTPGGTGGNAGASATPTGPSTSPSSSSPGPQVQIADPLDGSTAAQLAALPLRATAAQDGSPLADGDLSWSVTRDGEPAVVFSATGATATVPAAVMTAGTYHITVTATDSRGTAGATATVTVPATPTVVPSLPPTP